MSQRRSVRLIRPSADDVVVSWFPGSSSESIEVTCKLALGLPADALIQVRADNCVICLNEHLPDGLELSVVEEAEKARTTEEKPLLPSSSDEGFRGQLLKFERINAHLANERTWLAWIRTALGLLTCAFMLESQGTKSWTVTYFVLGCFFVASVDLAWITGWFRYRRTKEILAMAKENLPSKFYRVKIRFQAHVLGILFTTAAAVYVASGWNTVVLD